MSHKLKVMVSSTARDLPKHRKEVLVACLRQGMFPMMMEHLPASDAKAISASLQMVDEADVYVGVFAHRYGYVPKENNPRQISITEMEYERAAERKIPRLIFLMHRAHPITIDAVEQGEGVIKLDALKKRLETERVVNYFKSPADLRAHVIDSLSRFRKSDISNFHYISDIPTPPEAYIAHPYTLLQTHRLIGRQLELDLLTDWVANPESNVYKARVLNVIAVGGIGKSALTWTWFNDIGPQEMKPLAGRIWWSFYESDATFGNFVVRALAYTSRRTIEEVEQIPAPERETQLLATLNREPYLIVLDGMERILVAYARVDAARLEDSQVGNQRSLRKTADPRAGRFLKRLAQVISSRILVSSRLYPAELETEGGEPVPGGFIIEIKGLTDEDAIELWRALNVMGSRNLLLPVFATFNKHPLLIQALAGEVKRYRRGPGDFEEWRKANPRFNPTKFPRLQEAMGHVLEFALRGLDEKAHKVLQIIAAFRMPARYDTLATLLVSKSKLLSKGKKPCRSERELDEVLTELEDRGLVGWDRRANRYDLHPIVRGVVWSSLGYASRRDVYTSLHAHFEELPDIDEDNARSIEELTTTIELYNTLIGLERYDDAYELFSYRLNETMLHRLSANRQRVELLEMLFPNGLERLPCLNSQDSQRGTLTALAHGFRFIGQPRRAATLLHRAINMAAEVKRNDDHSITLGNLSEVLRLSGSLFASEVAALNALAVTPEQDDPNGSIHYVFWGLTLAARGRLKESNSALAQALTRFVSKSESQLHIAANFFIVQRSLWVGEFAYALWFANMAWEWVARLSYEGDLIRAARLQGEAAMKLNDLSTAEERLHYALSRARVVSLIEDEIPALVALAELRRRQGDLKGAREFLDDVWEAAEQGPYPLSDADAHSVLAQIERDEGDTAAAIEAAMQAYLLSWCDAPPYAYQWGLAAARNHLRDLGAPEPELPPFDKSSFELLPKVEIDSKVQP